MVIPKPAGAHKRFILGLQPIVVFLERVIWLPGMVTPLLTPESIGAPEIVMRHWTSGLQERKKSLRFQRYGKRDNLLACESFAPLREFGTVLSMVVRLQLVTWIPPYVVLFLMM
jgi:hypothetical protein